MTAQELVELMERRVTAVDGTIGYDGATVVVSVRFTLAEFLASPFYDRVNPPEFIDVSAVDVDDEVRYALGVGIVRRSDGETR